MIEDDEALKHQQNAAPGEKQTLANSLKQQGRREQEGIETRCLRFGTRNSSLKAFEKMAGSPNRSLYFVSVDDSFTEIAEFTS
jgi:hypothetical protein